MTVWVIIRKWLILVIAALLTVGTLFTLCFYVRVPLGEPKLRIEFYPPPPWQVKLGDSFEVSIGVANDGWLLAWAKDVRVKVIMPEGFTNSRTGTNECELNFFNLHGGDGLGNGITITASSNISPGNYTITIKLYGKNVPDKIFTPQLVVLAP